MGQPMFIRSLTPEDYDSLITLWEKSQLPYRSEGRDSRASIQKQIEEYPDLFLGAFLNNGLIGAVIASFDGRKGWINRLAVSPECRRQGVARELINAAENALKKRGASVIGALIFETNEKSLNFFEKVGYTIHDDIRYVSKRESTEC